MIRLSVVVITYNEERNLARCLESVKGIADELLVVDSNSTDGTIAIAERYNARVIQKSFAGYAAQKNFASANAQHDWILSLDADEELTPTLKNSVQKVKEQQRHIVYQMPRLTNYCGQWIKHCGWYPDRQTRLYNKTKGKWVEKKVHEYWQVNNNEDTKGLLAGDLLHYSFANITEHLKKIERYSELAATAAVEDGKDAGLMKIILSPFWHFFSEYFIKLGFMDGFYGFMICRLSAYSAFIKYTKIRLYRRA